MGGPAVGGPAVGGSECMSLAGGGLNGEKGWFLGGVRTARRKYRQETCDSKLSSQAPSVVHVLNDSFL